MIDVDLVIVFLDFVYVVKNDCVLFVNWYWFVDGYRVNFVLLWIVRMDFILKGIFLLYLFLVVCWNRDCMDVDMVVEICFLEVRKGF